MLAAGAFHVLNDAVAKGITCMDIRSSWGAAEDIKILVRVVPVNLWVPNPREGVVVFFSSADRENMSGGCSNDS
jgi:hypothetical protein